MLARPGDTICPVSPPSPALCLPLPPPPWWGRLVPLSAGVPISLGDGARHLAAPLVGHKRPGLYSAPSAVVLDVLDDEHITPLLVGVPGRGVLSTHCPEGQACVHAVHVPALLVPVPSHGAK